MSPRGGKRVGAGRPKIVEEPVTLSLWVDRALLEKARRAAEARGTSLPDVLRAMLSRLAGGKPRAKRRK
jgi:hypothetical protein